MRTQKASSFAGANGKNSVSAKKTLRKLKEKAQYVQRHNTKRKPHYAIFAKAFKEKTQDAILFDLDDLAGFL